MGISGKYVKTFDEANIACAVNVSMDADLPHFWFDVVTVADGMVTLKDRGEELTLPIEEGKSCQSVEVPMVSTWERLFQKGQPSIYKFVPFKGERF